MTPFMKYSLVALMLTGLTACDNAADKTTTTPAKPAETNTAPAADAKADVKTAPAADAKAAPATNAKAAPAAETPAQAAPSFAMKIPQGFTDKSPAVNEKSASRTRIFVNPETRQMITVVTINGVAPVKDEQAKASLEQALPDLLKAYEKQYSTVKVSKKEVITLADHAFLHLDAALKQQDKHALNTTLLTQQGTQVINVQMMTVSNDKPAHDALVKQISSQISFK
ncbi:DcrB-related protein [Chimaeribacter californicus]|uniref:DcrB-related protein n=1 Tax=Chimaeribacter californicus TaxID=2060067 RepID=UPI0011AEE3E1|nr:DcrB-related protein [Chimaeribacter californicus]